MASKALKILCVRVSVVSSQMTVSRRSLFSLNSFPHKRKHNEAPFKVYEIYHTKIPLLAQALFDILVSVRALGQNNTCRESRASLYRVCAVK
mgnify:CR=1 FL=1